MCSSKIQENWFCLIHKLAPLIRKLTPLFRKLATLFRKLTSHQQKGSSPPYGEQDPHTQLYLLLLNCSTSVDPFNAVVEDVPPVITIDT
jgi:hypothetical protein